jgi:SAM-dependent methyltransferase
MSPRGRYEGVLNILRFNWPTYVAACGIGLSALGVASAVPLPPIVRIAALVIGVVPLLLVLSSLGVSYWVYDRSILHRWTWLRPLLPEAPASIVNIHAGFDETSPSLRSAFPHATLSVLDFYDPEHHTEPSIARARAAYPASATSVPAGAWGSNSGSAQLIVCCFAVHEIRDEAQRIDFFREAYRVAAPDGRIVLIEHQRDLPNFLAFGPGAFHFLSPRSWYRAIHGGGLAIERTVRVTPFVTVRVLTKR